MQSQVLCNTYKGKRRREEETKEKERWKEKEEKKEKKGTFELHFHGESTNFG